jgi:hypothetical protein
VDVDDDDGGSGAPLAFSSSFCCCPRFSSGLANFNESEPDFDMTYSVIMALVARLQPLWSASMATLLFVGVGNVALTATLL